MPSRTQTHTFTHPELGTITGLAGSPSTPNVVHFRSIPFASIPARFRQSVLLDHIPSSRTFTEYGTYCPSPVQDQQRANVGGWLPGEEEKIMDEMTCLNLTISAPRDALGEEGKVLPVMVYVHGGGFTEGSGHISALHDTTRLVELSIKEGHPVIIVSIHYRLHWLGFLACQDIVDEARSFNEPVSNFGLHDQRTAFKWIQRFISGFGGDPNRVTAFGESAGSGSIAFHMCSDVPLFNRAILMSGLPSTLSPINLNHKEAEYRALLGFCGIDENDPDRLQKLRDVPAEKLVQSIMAVGMPMFHIYQDEIFFSRGFPIYFTENKLVAGCEWVDEIIIGDCFFEGWLMSALLQHVPLEPFINVTQKILGVSNADKVLAANGITPGMDPNAFWTKLNFMMGDMTFSQPIHKVSSFIASLPPSATKKKIYRYTQTYRNPFPGSTLYQIPGHHFIDMLFLFGTLKERYPSQKLRDLSDEFGKRWLRFGVGLAPWEEYVLDGREGEGKIMVINGRNGFDLRSRKEDVEQSRLSEEGERRYVAWETMMRVMDGIAREQGVAKGEAAMWKWLTNDGMLGLVGIKGPYGDLDS